MKQRVTFRKSNNALFNILLLSRFLKLASCFLQFSWGALKSSRILQGLLKPGDVTIIMTSYDNCTCSLTFSCAASLFVSVTICFFLRFYCCILAQRISFVTKKERLVLATSAEVVQPTRSSAVSCTLCNIQHPFPVFPIPVHIQRPCPDFSSPVLSLSAYNE